VITLDETNQALLAQRDILGELEEIHFESAGNTVQGWLVWPPNVTRAPDPAGGRSSGEPRIMFGYEFALEAHILAASGYAVFAGECPRLARLWRGVRQPAADALPGDDFDDAMRGVEAAIARGGIDTRRVALVGGAVAAWALGHTSASRPWWRAVRLWMATRLRSTPMVGAAPRGWANAVGACAAVRAHLLSMRLDFITPR